VPIALCQKKLRIWFKENMDHIRLILNAMVGKNGERLRHFTPFPTPKSDGVNVFSQEIEKEENPFAFPPFLILPLLN
jgi:hypothetical protein